MSKNTIISAKMQVMKEENDESISFLRLFNQFAPVSINTRKRYCEATIAPCIVSFSHASPQQLDLTTVQKPKNTVISFKIQVIKKSDESVSVRRVFNQLLSSASTPAKDMQIDSAQSNFISKLLKKTRLHPYFFLENEQFLKLFETCKSIDPQSKFVSK